jgi:hypothetical protein
MSYFVRFNKYRKTSVAKGDPSVLPEHLQDKNQSHSDQGANGSVPTQEGALAQQQADGDESDFQPYDDLDTTNQ